MKKLFFALLASLPILAHSQALPIYVPRTNGQGWNATFTATSGNALTVRSNMQMGIAGGIGWAGATEPYLIDHFPNVHGAGRNALGLFGDPDLVLSPAQYGTGGGFLQIGNHSLFSSEAFMAYASSGPAAGDVGHSTTLGFEARYNTGVTTTFAKPQIIGRPGTNVVSDGWVNGFFEFWDVPAAWRSDVFSSAPNAEAGRRIGRLGIDGLFLYQNESGMSAGGFTNFGNGTATVGWTASAGSPEGAKTAAIGSLHSRTDGGAATTLYVKESGTGNTGWVAVGGGGDSLWVLNEDSGPGAAGLLSPVDDVPSIGSISGPFNIQAATALKLYADGGNLNVTIEGNVMDIGADVKISTLSGGGDKLVYADTDGLLTEAAGATYPNGVVFSSTPVVADLTAGGDVSLFTVPAGKVFIITSAAVLITGDDNFTVAGTVLIKCGVGTLSSTVTLTAAESGKLFTLTALTSGFRVAAADEIEAEVTASTADTLTGKIMVTGYYIAE